MSRNRQVFGLGINPPRRLPGTKSSGILPVRYPTPLRASPGISPDSLAPAHPRKGRLDAVGSAADINRQAGQHSPEDKVSLINQSATGSSPQGPDR